MTKTFLSTLVAATLAFYSLPSTAENLQNVYQLALKKDPAVLKSAAQRDAAKANIDISRANFLPSIGLSTGISYATGEQVLQNGAKVRGNGTSGSAGVNLKQTIFDWTDWSNLSTAEKQALQAQTAYNAAQQGLIFRVSQAYFGVLSATDDVTFITAEKRAVERQLLQTKERFAVGLTAITDVHDAQAQFDSVVAREINAMNQLESAKQVLQEITGNYHSSLDPLNTTRFAAKAPVPTEANDWIKIAEEKNFDLQIRKLAVEIAQNNIDVADAGHYPKVDLTASAGLKDSNSELPTDSESIGINMTMPLYAGGAITAGSEVQRANFVATSEDLELGHRSVLRQVRTSFNSVGAAIASIKALEQAVVSAESALKATEAGFEVGTRTIVDVLISTRNLFDARRNLTKARYDYILSVLALKQAAGTLTEDDLALVNQALGS